MAQLSPKQRQFVSEYLIDLNGTQAAIRAGYSVATANEQSSRLLAKVHVQVEIQRAMAERSRRTGISQDRIINELAKIAFLNVTDVIDLDDATIRREANREDTACLASVKVKTIPTDDGSIVEREVKAYDKIRALELLGKHLNMFTDKLKVEGAMPVVILDDLEEGG